MRLGKACAALLMLIVFGAGTVLALPLVLIAIAVYALTGSAWCEEYVGFRGKSFDQVCNAYWCGGHPKETISSHAGRWIASGLPLPLWVRVVRAVTDVFERDHCVKAIEEPFRGLPL